MDERNRNISRFMLGFQRIFILIRSQIIGPYNISLLEKISKYSLKLKEESAIQFEMFKAEILKIVNENTEMRGFLENALNIEYISFVTDNLSEINGYLSVISDTALEICKHLKHDNFDRAYDLVDAIHCLPEAIMSKKHWNSKAFWKTYFMPYRKKWDNNFLSIKEKELVKSSILRIFKK